MSSISCGGPVLLNAVPGVPHRPLGDEGREVRISFAAVWSADSPLAADLLRLADSLAAAR